MILSYYKDGQRTEEESKDCPLVFEAPFKGGHYNGKVSVYRVSSGTHCIAWEGDKTGVYGYTFQAEKDAKFNAVGLAASLGAAPVVALGSPE